MCVSMDGGYLLFIRTQLVRFDISSWTFFLITFPFRFADEQCLRSARYPWLFSFFFFCMTGKRLIMYRISFNTYFDPSLDLFFFLSSSFLLHIGNLFICSCRATGMIASLLLVLQYLFSSHNVLSLPRPVCSCQLWPVNFFSLCPLLYYAMAMLPQTFPPFLLSVKSYPHVSFSFPFPFVAFMDGWTKYARISFSYYLFAIIVLRASFERLGLILFWPFLFFSL